MKNPVAMRLTEFIDLDNKGNRISSSFGFRIADEHEALYNCEFKTATDLKNEIKPSTVLKVIKNMFPDFYYQVVSYGLLFNDKLYSYVDLKKLEMKEKGK